jgi:uncharacterized membrane protein
MALASTFPGIAPAPPSPGVLAPLIIGFALGGFFDGILLHQVLQWHHFLSLVGGETFRDIRIQILADGLFHVAVYLIACVGLWLLWRQGKARPAERAMLAWAVLGFSLWQFVDVVLAHWAIGLHRTRVDVPDPLSWDLGWLAVFGLIPLLLGLWLLKTAGAEPPSGTGGDGRRTAAVLTAAVLLSAPLASWPAGGNGTVVVFRPGIGAQAAFAAAAAAEARIVWSAADGEVLGLELPPGSSAWALYRHGAVLVGGTGPLSGCLGWVRA